jgi:hypothetical protein
MKNRLINLVLENKPTILKVYEDTDIGQSVSRQLSSTNLALGALTGGIAGAIAVRRLKKKKEEESKNK